MKKIVNMLSVLAVAGILTASAGTAHAVYYVEDDTSIAHELETIERLKDEILLLQQQLTELNKLNFSSPSIDIDTNTLTKSLSGILQQMTAIDTQNRAIGLDYKKVQQEFDATYKDFGAFNTMSGADYASYYQKITDEAQKKIERALASQSLASQILPSGRTNTEEVIQNLHDLVTRSQSAPGALAALQVANQIAAIQTQEITKLEQIMADSMGAETLYWQTQIEKEKFNTESAEKIATPGIEPLKSDQQSEGDSDQDSAPDPNRTIHQY